MNNLKAAQPCSNNGAQRTHCSLHQSGLLPFGPFNRLEKRQTIAKADYITGLQILLMQRRQPQESLSISSPVHGWQLLSPSPISQTWPHSHAPLNTVASWAAWLIAARGGWPHLSTSDTQVGGKEQWVSEGGGKKKLIHLSSSKLISIFVWTQMWCHKAKGHFVPISHPLVSVLCCFVCLLHLVAVNAFFSTHTGGANLICWVVQHEVQYLLDTGSTGYSRLSVSSLLCIFLVLFCVCLPLLGLLHVSICANLFLLCLLLCADCSWFNLSNGHSSHLHRLYLQNIAVVLFI